MNQYRCEHDMVPEKCASIGDDGICYCSEHLNKCPHFPEHTHHSVKSERDKVLNELSVNDLIDELLKREDIIGVSITRGLRKQVSR